MNHPGKRPQGPKLSSRGLFAKGGLSRLGKNILKSAQVTSERRANSTNGMLGKLKFLPNVLSKKERQTLSAFTLVFTVSLVWLISSIWLAITEAVPRAGGSYTEGIIGRPRAINPLYADINAADRDLTRLLYAGLVKFDGETIVPDLSESWTISEDQLTYTFNLRQNIFWPDEVAFTADDVVFTIETIKNKDYQSPLRGNFANVDIARADDYTVSFTLPKPLTPFLEDLTIGILPAHIWQNVRPENILLTNFNIRPLGLGPYQFERLVKDQFGSIRSYVLTSNDDYHLGQPLIKKLELRFYPDEIAALEALDRREIEGINFLSSDRRSQIDTSRTNIRALQLSQYTAVFFNLSSSSPIADKSVRQALARAIDKSQIVEEAINGEGRIIHGPILPGYPGYHPDIERFNFDPTTAATALLEAGWELQDGKRINEDEEELRLTLTTADRPELAQTAELIREAWVSLGIQTDLKITSIEKIQEDVISPRNFEILIFGEIIGNDPDPYPFWHSSQISSKGLNLSNFKNREADQVLAEARQTANQDKKNEKYVHFQNILVAEMPAIFLYNPNYLYPSINKIKGLDQSRIIIPADRFANVHQWFIKTKRVFR